MVYKCKDTKLNRTKAVKVIHPRLLSSSNALARFRQEVAISQELQHENIVRVYDLEEWEGKEYFTMEWVEGKSLREILIERKKKNKPFTLEEAYQIISQLADALHYAHQYTIHRDIKPENILVTGDGLKVKLTDFGIAKMLSPSQFTTTSVQMGTPYYMAPEQKSDAAHVDKRADIYAVGVVLFELLTLENTIGLETPSEINDDLPREVDAVIKKALATKPEGRYGDIKELAEALGDVIQKEKRCVEEETRKADELKRREKERLQKEAAERKKQEEQASLEAERQEQEEAGRKAREQQREAEERRHREEKEREAEERRREAGERANRGGETKAKADEASLRAEEEAERKREEARRTKEATRRKVVLFAVILVVVIGIIYLIQRPKGSQEKPLYTDPVTGMEFVLVKGGCYQMGDTFGDGNPNEKPVHEVCLNDFYIGKYEVTQKQWKEIMANNPSHFTGCDNCPVENVNWNDVQEFIARLNERTGQKYRLPTEAEWEYAARSGGKKEKWPGTNNESELGEYAWYLSNSGEIPHPVGLKRPNGLGLYDMAGNVWELVQDRYSADAYRNHTGKNPICTDGNFQVIRGGCWTNRDSREMQCFNRADDSQPFNSMYLGLRFVKSIFPENETSTKVTEKAKVRISQSSIDPSVAPASKLNFKLEYYLLAPLSE